MKKERLIELYLQNNDRMKETYEDLILAEQELARYREETIAVSKDINSQCLEQGMDQKEADYQSMSYYDSRMNNYDYDTIETLRARHTVELEMREIYELAIAKLSEEN